MSETLHIPSAMVRAHLKNEPRINQTVAQTRIRSFLSLLDTSKTAFTLSLAKETREYGAVLDDNLDMNLLREPLVEHRHDGISYWQEFIGALETNQRAQMKRVLFATERFCYFSFIYLCSL